MTEAVAAMRGGKLAARYTLLDKLGAGGQGEVWRAHDGTRGVDIALKVLNPGLMPDEEAWSALEHEYAIASRLDHPAILKVFPPDRTGDVMVLPMELASGGDLRRLRGAGFLEIIPVLLEIAQALEHAHERGVVHRDLKPGNVLFDARGRARLADFGVAETAITATDMKSAAQGTARDSNRHGLSPFTASPAQLRGEPPKPADDIYGLGALAYELLSGYPPYYPHFDRKRAIEEPVPDLVPTRQIPALLNTLVTRMLAKDPAQRPASMREVIDELDAALNETLIFDFDDVSEPPAGPEGRSSGTDGMIVPAMFSSAEPAANMSEGPPKVPDWTPNSSVERRATPDRRRAPRPPPPAAQIREPSHSSTAFAAGGRGAARSSNTGANRPPLSDRRTSGSPAGARVTSRASADGSPVVDRRTDRGLPRGADRAARAQPGANRDELPDVSRESNPDAIREWHPGVNRESHPRDDRDERAGLGRDPGRAVSPASGTSAGRASSRSAAGNTAQGPGPVASAAAPAGAMHQPWRAIPLDGLPRVSRLEPIRSRRWPWVLLGLLAAGAAAVYYELPGFDPQTLPGDLSALIAPIESAVAPKESPAPSASTETASVPAAAGTTAAAAASSTPPSPVAHRAPAAPAPTPASTAPASGSATTSPVASERHLRVVQQGVENRLAMLEARGAGAWGGHDFAMAKSRVAEAVGARDAGNTRMAQERLAAAGRLLDSVESKAPQALIAQIAAGEAALGTGQQGVADQAFDLARRIDPNDRRASDGQRRAQSLNGVLPLLADAENAEVARDYARAAQDYSQALSLDPGNVKARAGQARANAAFGDDSYAKAVGAGFAALGAGRLDESHDDFVKARALKPNGAEASEGLRRVGAALTARGFASIRQRAAGLEAQERWDEAEQAYAAVLSADPSLAFAQQGKARASSRAELSGRLQQLIDRPDRLSSAGVRDEALSLLETAQAQTPSGPVLRSQIARLEILLPGYDKPVRLSLLSDNSTQVAISSIGSFGAFSRREIELKPGKYIVVGTRSGFRDVRREITVAPGQETQTIRVSCSEPI